MPIPDQIHRLIELPDDDADDEGDDENELTPEDVQEAYSTLSDSDIYVAVDPDGAIVHPSESDSQPTQCDISAETPGLRNEPVDGNENQAEEYDEFIGFTFSEVADRWVVAWDDRTDRQHSFLSLFPVENCQLSRNRFVPRIQLTYRPSTVRVAHDLNITVNVDIATTVTGEWLDDELNDITDEIDTLTVNGTDGVRLSAAGPVAVSIINSAPGPGRNEVAVNHIDVGSWYRFEFVDTDGPEQVPDEVYGYDRRGSEHDHLEDSEDGIASLTGYGNRIVAVADGIEGDSFVGDYDMEAPISHAEPVDPNDVDIPLVEEPEGEEAREFDTDEGRVFGYNPDTDEVVTQI